MAEVEDIEGKNISRKTKQWVYLGLVIAAIVLLSIMGVWLANRPSDAKAEIQKGIDGASVIKPEKPPETISFATPKVDPAEAWRGIEGNKLKDLETQNAFLNKRFDELLKEKADAAKTHLADTTPLPNKSGKGGYTAPKDLPPPPPLPNGGGNYTPLNTVNSGQESGTSRAFGIETVSMGQSANGAPAALGAKAEKPIKIRNAATYLPSGSYVRALILGGLDAPTGGQAQNDPQPVLLKLIDSAALPNRFRSDVKECVMSGSGYGNISSERAALRIETLSCILKNGNAIDVTAQGYVVGEDGKAGLRGRLVSKQGQLIANTLIAGMLSGFGSVLSASSTINQTTALGTTATIDPNKAVQAGFGKGASSAMERLAQYYISLAEKIFPVIEVDAGRVVEVVFSQGLELDLASSADGDTGEGQKMSELMKKFRARQNGNVDMMKTLGVTP